MKVGFYKIALVVFVVISFYQFLVFFGYTYGASDYIFSSMVKSLNKERPIMLVNLVDNKWDIACIALPYENPQSLMDGDERKSVLSKVRGVGNNAFIGGLWRIFFIHEDQVFTRVMIGMHTKNDYYFPKKLDIPEQMFQSAICASYKEAALYFDGEFIVFGRMK